MNKRHFPVDGSWMFARYSDIDHRRPTVLFLHGLGESSRSFAEAFERTDLSGFNRIAPDLVGFGSSSAAADGRYDFDVQGTRVLQLLDLLVVDQIALVGHSMGGDLATVLTERMGKRVEALVNIEGNLSIDDLFISSKVKEADEKGELSTWLYSTFARDMVLEDWGKTWPSCRRYFESLMNCRVEAMRESALGLVERNAQSGTSLATDLGRQFANLSEIPKVYCWGARSVKPEARHDRLQLLADLKVKHREFSDAFHWLMIDRADEFYPFLRRFLECGETSEGHSVESA